MLSLVLRRSWAALLLGSLLMMALGGCGDGQAPPAGEHALEPVVAVGSQWYGHIPVWAGIERGIFERHGFRVEWRTIGKSMDRLNAISSGEAQFASLGEIAMLSAMAQGNTRFYWVGNQDIAPGFEGLVAQPGVEDFDDLRGGRIGFPFGSSVELTARMLLREHGLDPDRDVRLVNLEVGDVPAVFRAGNVDAAGVWEPGFSQLKAVPGARVLGMDTDTEVYQRFGTMTGPDVLILGRDWVDADHIRARHFMAAYFEALDWVRDHPDEVVQLVAGRWIQQEPDLIAANLARFQWHDAADNRRVMNDDGIFAQADFILDILHGQMHALPRKPDFRAWVRLDLLPEPESELELDPGLDPELDQ
ncbi:MAG: ABC transporter substrate-binding protein [Thiohalocapsa sp.]|jgi:ABC-type nitrate/sulfonate/bicarbonate transport system substrate-binding protein|uniref:ABC transporter substrate-binding protein n=1 Tax=Thiohalocapsa sp. TaxID=2497641 RepID=UPI0025F2B058|nr:ABC transporter substrate-binding protein [Thiohalocapsa sp.]MCG6942769.1 ABC transporter substrate-binding protein [Thiohalocapsa sp.]